MKSLSRWLFGDLHKAIAELSSQFVIQQDAIIMSLEKLREEIAQNREVTASAVALLQGLKAKLDAAISTGDMAEVEKLAQELDASNNELAAAVTANTPSEAGAGGTAGAGGDEPQPGQPVDDGSGAGADAAGRV